MLLKAQWVLLVWVLCVKNCKSSQKTRLVAFWRKRIRITFVNIRWARISLLKDCKYFMTIEKFNWKMYPRKVWSYMIFKYTTYLRFISLFVSLKAEKAFDHQVSNFHIKCCHNFMHLICWYQNLAEIQRLWFMTKLLKWTFLWPYSGTSHNW